MKKNKPKRGGQNSNMRRLPHKDLMKLAVYGTVGLGAAQNASADTLITFGGFTGDNTRIDTIIGYGDNVSGNSADYSVSLGRGGVVGTPDITMDWLGQWETYTLWDGRGNVAQSDFNGGTLSLLFTPTASTAVRLVSYDLDEYVGGGPGSIAWSIFGSTSGVITNGNWTMGNAGGRSLVAPDVTGLLGESLTLTLTLNSGAPSYFALDNLIFDQVAPVPEPSTFALGVLGALAFGAAAMRRRRRS
jgi:MYXO-CTERM domain-containing protein